MNIWKWITFYIYSGVALGGLCAGKASELCAGIAAPEGADDTQYEKCRTNALDRVVRQSMVIGNLMADATTMDLIGSYQSALINQYEQAKKQNDAALKVVPPANRLGA